MVIYIDFDEFEPWGQAVDTYNRIADEDKLDALENMLEDQYPDGMSETDLNDLLAYEPESVFDALGIEYEE